MDKFETFLLYSTYFKTWRRARETGPTVWPKTTLLLPKNGVTLITIHHGSNRRNGFSIEFLGSKIIALIIWSSILHSTVIWINGRALGNNKKNVVYKCTTAEKWVMTLVEKTIKLIVFLRQFITKRIEYVSSPLQFSAQNIFGQFVILVHFINPNVICTTFFSIDKH